MFNPNLSVPRSGDRDLLFAVLAMDLDFLEPESFNQIWKEWKSQALMPWPDFLVARKVLSSDERQVLARIMERKLRKHEGQIEPCLQDLGEERARKALAALASVSHGNGHSNGYPSNGDEKSGFTESAAVQPASPKGRWLRFGRGAGRWSRVLIGTLAVLLVCMAIVTLLQIPEGAGGRGGRADDEASTFTALGPALPAVGMPASPEQIEANDRERAERYPKVLAQAEKQWQRGKFHDATALLEMQQPPRLESRDLRNFEWHYLHRIYSASPFDFPVGQGILVALAYNGDGSRLLTVAESGQVKVWDSTNGHLLRQWNSSSNRLSAAAFSRDAERLVTATQNKAIQLWDVPKAALLGSIRTKSEELLRELAVSPDASRCVVTAGNDPSLSLWDLQTKTEIASLRGHASEVTSVAFSPDGRQIASASLDGSVRLWQTERTGREIRSFHLSETPDAAQCNVRFSPDGDRLAACSGKVIQIWDRASGDRVAALTVQKGGPFRTFCFSPDGTRVASASTDDILRIWDATSGHELLGLVAGSSNHCTFNPDGTSLAAQVLQNTPTVENFAVIWETRPTSAEEQDRREAVRVVAELYHKTVDRQEVKDRISKDPWLSPKVRAAALGLAEKAELDPAVLNNTSWNIVRTPGLSKEAYTRALHQAEEAVRRFPSAGFFVNTLGIAQYRLEKYPEALKTLLRSSKLNAGMTLFGRVNGMLRVSRARDGSNQPADIAFLAMTRYQLGQTEDALQGLSRLRSITERQARMSEWSAGAAFNEAFYQESLDFLHEAEALIEKSSQ